MKRIICLDKGKFLTIDSYGESLRVHLMWNVFIAISSILVMAMTFASALGFDITSPTPNPTPNSTWKQKF